MAIPRYGEPKDAAGIVAWLANEEGRFVTGAALTIRRRRQRVMRHLD